MALMSATDKIDVSIEHKQATLDDGTAKKHPNTCPDCGSIRVIANNGEWIDEVDLASKGRHDRKIVWHWDNGQAGFWKEEGSGHIVIEVTSKGKPVLIDGLLQGPSLDEEGVEP